MQQVSKLLDKPMDRKDFLRHIGLGAAMLMGGNLIVKGAMAGSTKQQSSRGYGSSPYGG